jgi:hypothetical protein
VQLDQRVRLDQLVHKALKVLLARLVHKEILGQQAHKVFKVSKAFKAIQVLLALRVILALLVPKVILGQLVRQAQLVLLVRLVLMARHRLFTNTKQMTIKHQAHQHTVMCFGITQRKRQQRN